MGSIGGFAVGRQWLKAECYVFSERFRQRPVGKTFGSVRSLIPLRTMSGPQWAESELEAKAIQQFAFQPQIYDIFTQPIIYTDNETGIRSYTPDFLVQLSSEESPPVRRFVIEVKRKAALERLDLGARQRIGLGRRFAKAIKAEFRILTEAEIETDYLSNVQLLDPHFADQPGDGWEEIMDITERGPISWGKLAQELAALNISRPKARAAIEAAIAWRAVLCDLSVPIGEQSILRKSEHCSDRMKLKFDPFINTVLRANNGAGLAI
jgi:hypothetical protein